MKITGICILFCLQFGEGPPAVDAARFCSTYEPVQWSSKDTRLTKEQVDVNNRKYKALGCAKEK